jgi:hypothetical protein
MSVRWLRYICSPIVENTLLYAHKMLDSCLRHKCRYSRYISRVTLAVRGLTTSLLDALHVNIVLR